MTTTSNHTPAPLLFLDTETTGLDPDPGRLREMADMMRRYPFPNRETLLMRLSYLMTAHVWVSTDDLSMPWRVAADRLWCERRWSGRTVRRGVY